MTGKYRLLVFLSILIATTYTLSTKAAAPTSEQELTDTIGFKVEFRLGASILDPNYRDNAKEIAGIKHFLDELKKDDRRAIKKMVLSGSVSPEGSLDINKRLTESRVAELQKLIGAHTPIMWPVQSSFTIPSQKETDQMAERLGNIHTTWIGIDNAAVSFIYTFNK